MTKRYGRNQRRKHREEQKFMQFQMQQYDGTIRRLKYQLSDQRNIGFNDYAKNHALYDLAIKEIARSFGPIIGEKLKPYAEQLLKQVAYDDRMPMTIDLQDKFGVAHEQIMTITLNSSRSIVIGLRG